MRLLVVGGAGFVGSLVLPHLERRHRLKVFDLREPRGVDAESVRGSLDDFPALAGAARGCDALLFMAMNVKEPWGELPTVVSAYDVNVKGLHLAHLAAREVGIRRIVVTSSLSVYAPRPPGVRYPTEEAPPDADDFYGLTKRLGEEVSRSAARTFGQNVTSLRLCFPWPDDQPPPGGRETDGVTGEGVTFRAATFTRARDVASAIDLALGRDRQRDGEHHGDEAGWEAFAISGDPDQRVVPTGKARQVLGWKPTLEERP